MKKVLLTGATGLIGRKIAKELISRGDKVSIVTRSSEKARALIAGAENYIEWNSVRSNWSENFRDIDAVIHLAGENVMARRWNKVHKEKIYNSRIDSTRNLTDSIRNSVNKPKVFIAASAVGYYGSSEEPVTEESISGKDFLADVVKAWEGETSKIDEFGVRRVNIRTGIVLDKSEGALAQMITPFKLFIGGPLGSGRQWFPWIHIDDVAGIFLHALDNENVAGVLNAVSPNPVRMNEFCRLMGKIMKRPSIFKVPPFVLGIIFGEGAGVLLTGAQAIPKKTIELGYKYKFEKAENALTDLLKN